MGMHELLRLAINHCLGGMDMVLEELRSESDEKLPHFDF